MHHNHFDAIALVQKLAYMVPPGRCDGIEVERPSAVHRPRSIQTMIDADRLPFKLGAQHCHWEEKGAFTGEVSPGVPGQARSGLPHRRALGTPGAVPPDRRAGGARPCGPSSGRG